MKIFRHVHVNTFPWNTAYQKSSDTPACSELTLSHLKWKENGPVVITQVISCLELNFLLLDFLLPLDHLKNTALLKTDLDFHYLCSELSLAVPHS